MTDRGGTCLASLRDFFSHDARVLDWGVAPAAPAPKAEALRNWIADKHHAGMEYMASRLGERMNPKSLHAWAESVILFAFPYAARLQPGKEGYRVAAYAQGEDYHKVARGILRDAEARLRSLDALSGLRFYGFADTAPVFERDLAAEAGLGWRGKNCCTLNRKHGSAFHLAGFFLDIPLPASLPVEDFCGGCTRCIDQCPTDAFLAPGKLDANKCISYWTIEDKGPLPEPLSDRFGAWIFGCDVCQEVCPWNHKHIKAGSSPPDSNASLPDSTGQSGNGEIRLGEGGSGKGQFPGSGAGWVELLRKGGGFRSRFRRSPLDRAGRRSLLRNVAAAARNLRDTSAAEPLRAALELETDPALRREIEKTLEALSKEEGDGGSPP